MKKAKIISKNSSSKTNSNEHSNSLFVAISDVETKRKNLLLTIKDALVLQEEDVKIIELRKSKAKVLDEIKKDLNLINTDYQKLKKIFPNVTNLISHTEKEFEVLNISRNSLEKKSLSKKEKISKEDKIKSNTNTDLNKMDRIRNNLKVIESKLNNL